MKILFQMKSEDTYFGLTGDQTYVAMLCMLLQQIPFVKNNNATKCVATKYINTETKCVEKQRFVWKLRISAAV